MSKKTKNKINGRNQKYHINKYPIFLFKHFLEKKYLFYNVID